MQNTFILVLIMFVSEKKYYLVLTLLVTNIFYRFISLLVVSLTFKNILKGHWRMISRLL